MPLDRCVRNGNGKDQRSIRRDGAVIAMEKLTAEINEYEVARGNDPLTVEQVYGTWRTMEKGKY